MTNPNITPGPWHINGEEIEGLAAPRESSSYYAPVCTMENEWEKSIAEANARAIAAVPALLEALELLFTAYEGQTKATNGDELSPFIVDEVLAMEKAKSALIAAGYQF